MVRHTWASRRAAMAASSAGRSVVIRLAPFDFCQVATALRTDLWGDFRQRPLLLSSRVSECRLERDGGDDNPKAEVAPIDARGEPIASGAARAVSIVVPRPATQHPQDLISCFQVLPPIVRLVRIGEVRANHAPPPQTPRPLPHIPGHVHAAVRAIPLRRELADRRRVAPAALAAIAPL
jgi:hypothetical protein